MKKRFLIPAVCVGGFFGLAALGYAIDANDIANCNAGDLAACSEVMEHTQDQITNKQWLAKKAAAEKAAAEQVAVEKAAAVKAAAQQATAEEAAAPRSCVSDPPPLPPPPPLRRSLILALTLIDRFSLLILRSS